MSSFDRNFQPTSSCFGFVTSQQSSNDATSWKKREGTGTIDGMLSEALKDLTFEERQQQQEILHGVQGQMREEENMVQNTLQDLDKYLNNTKRGTYYETAESMNPDYVRARAFRIMFLRGNRYDAKAAAQQMLKFFEQKHKIFGDEKLVKDITLDDLDEDDIACLKTGASQLLGRDSANRQILLQVPSLRAFANHQNELRALYYILMTASRSQETQIRGCAAILYTVGDHKDAKKGVGYLDNMRLTMSLPLYMAGNHVCGDRDTAESFLWSVAVKMLPAKRRARLRMHFGSHTECQYLLSTYGIPSQMLPFRPGTYMVNLETHHNWCQSYLLMEKQKSGHVPSPLAVTQINANDVLYVDRKKNNNMGNQRLRALIKEFSSQYDAGSNETKKLMVDALLGEIRKAGGRFLKQQANCTSERQLVWEELSLEEARAKVTQLFRNNRRRPEASRDRIHGGFIISDFPRPNDVVFGKGARSPGSELLQRLIKNRSHEYDSLDRGMKKDLVDSILHQIKEQGGRFLQPTEVFGEFLAVTDDMARARISKYFRNNRRSINKTAGQSISSTTR
ncbi:unnamed protein product [Cylindrotheca closterium]|uniref:DUF6824 domain-containing protein n=1 Tax=Cylindrotheca closterium TaxID=2856 RepID=A0AAD2FKK3_9STRA|nr:unnamed protein product [Cylindrotheca closterium]